MHGVLQFPTSGTTRALGTVEICVGACRKCIGPSWAGSGRPAGRAEFQPLEGLWSQQRAVLALSTGDCYSARLTGGQVFAGPASQMKAPLAMSAPRDHHFIPVFFLKQWVAENGKLVEYTIKHDKLIAKPVGPRSTGFEIDLYAFDELPLTSGNSLRRSSSTTPTTSRRSRLNGSLPATWMIGHPSSRVVGRASSSASTFGTLMPCRSSGPRPHPFGKAAAKLRSSPMKPSANPNTRHIR
jgi:Protein of unknown function (DUF4238)